MLKLHVVAAFDAAGKFEEILASGNDAQECADVFSEARASGKHANLVFVRNAHAHKRWRNPALVAISKPSAPESGAPTDEGEAAPSADKPKRGRPKKADADKAAADAAIG